MKHLHEFNAAPAAAAQELALFFCGAAAWANAVVAQRPYTNLSELRAAAAELWEHADDAARLEAFAAHPLIGDVDHLRQKFAATARTEQGQVLSADEDTLATLAALNRQYLEHHKFIFIICATGRSAAQMLAALRARIDNSTDEEIANAAAEQAKITQLRIGQTFPDD
ncbi:MAG: 2-oxo-4-hydroxy-4-carboxy-5-ureidoimidazoline decarboxylase [Pseudomonadota bacterium]